MKSASYASYYPFEANNRTVCSKLVRTANDWVAIGYLPVTAGCEKISCAYKLNGVQFSRRASHLNCAAKFTCWRKLVSEINEYLIAHFHMTSDTVIKHPDVFKAPLPSQLISNLLWVIRASTPLIHGLDCD